MFFCFPLSTNYLFQKNLPYLVLKILLDNSFFCSDWKRRQEVHFPVQRPRRPPPRRTNHAVPDDRQQADAEERRRIPSQTLFRRSPRRQIGPYPVGGRIRSPVRAVQALAAKAAGRFVAKRWKLSEAVRRVLQQAHSAA